MPELREAIHATGPGNFGVEERGIIALVNEDRLRRILTRMLDENEFLSPYGIRSLSRYHAEHPYIFSVEGRSTGWAICRPSRTAACSAAIPTGAGPIWMPVNALIIRALMHYFAYYGDNFRIECPTGSGNLMNLFEIVAQGKSPIGLTRIFLERRRNRTAAGGWRRREIPARSPLAGPSAVL